MEGENSTRNRIPLYSELKKDKKAVSSAISTVILTGAVIAMIIVASVFAYRFLDSQLAESEFSAMKQFMQNVGLQIDDVAWILGRTQTIRYASRYGQVKFEPSTLNYTIYVNDVHLATYSVGIISFNMPHSTYTIGNDYYERLFPSSGSLLLQIGTSALVCYLFVVEKIPMPSGNFIRVVATPSIRMLNSTIFTGETEKNYFKFYLPVLKSGTSPHYSQSVTLVGSSVSVETKSGDTVRINVSFPRASEGFDADFFHFDEIEEIVNFPDDSVVEFFTGEVVVSLGLYA
jgi:hypothetical protein